MAARRPFPLIGVPSLIREGSPDDLRPPALAQSSGDPSGPRLLGAGARGETRFPLVRGRAKVSTPAHETVRVNADQRQALDDGHARTATRWYSSPRRLAPSAAFPFTPAFAARRTTSAKQSGDHRRRISAANAGHASDLTPCALLTSVSTMPAASVSQKLRRGSSAFDLSHPPRIRSADDRHVTCDDSFFVHPTNPPSSRRDCGASHPS